MFRLAPYSLFFGLLLCFTTLFSCRDTEGPVELTSGMHLTQSVTIKRDTFLLDPQGTDSSVLTISGDHLTIDFNGAVLKSAAKPPRANQFWGTAIRVLKGKNIQIKNVTVQGFKIGLLAINCDSLQLLDSDFSYNYRQQLQSGTPQGNRKKEGIAPQSDQENRMSNGAAVYLKNCQQAVVKNITITGGQNGLVLDHCQQGLFYNNTIQYNSGMGIGLYHSSNNWVMHNRLDWNVRNGQQGLDQPEQEAGGILAYGACRDNVVAYNSATHCDKGISFQFNPSVLADSACENNLIFGNDFSHAMASGVELPAGSNNIIYNHLEDCNYGIQASQIHHSLILGNTFRKNKQAIAINQDQNNVIRDNIFDQEKTAINLGALVAEYAPGPLADGQSTFLPAGSPRGRQYVLMTEWGPYDFRSPSLWLRSVEEDTYTFVILGPQGNWQLVGGTGIQQISRKRGAVPATVVVQGEEGLSLELKFIGEAGHTVFGEPIKKGKGVLFGWE